MVYRSWFFLWLLRVRHRVGQGWYQLGQWLQLVWLRPAPPPALAPATPPALPRWQRWLKQLLQQLSRFPLLRAAPPVEQLSGAPTMTALPVVLPAPVLPEPTLEVASVVAGYEPHWLELFLQWLDRTFYLWEQKIREFWHWLRGFWTG
ncbi:hypothetical protein GlitD10_0397 [Gloeomargarita lithophora Alchichica-D10]|uniref:Uncharacterized protein n=1 Tax=Gloeomargarita lithophora Alchichica-D10 TaxID=1188229 RepID=A0A1J0A9U2_9CYAN|nr:hypothetical protein [Gloeomargarita lithophora]APB32708.1 hypothetical protein GlitD10_0397 [Gloeomargarita lithophora Alchichica-D10]